MTQRKRPLRRYVEWTALFAAAGLAVLTGLWAGGSLQIGTAFFAGLAVLLIAAGAAGIVLRRIERLREFINTLDPAATSFVVFRRGMAGEITETTIRAGRQLSVRIEEMEREIAAAKQIVDRLPVPIVVVDPKGRIVSANRAARETLGNGLADRTLSSVIRDPGVLDAVDRVQAGAYRAEAEMSVVGPLTRQFQAHILSAELSREAGQAAIIALLDLTAAKRIDETRTDFVANVSHELRTPLTALIGFIETLRGPAIDDAAARGRFLEIMQEQSERMLRLISDLMSLSRVEMNEHSRPTGRTDVVAIAQSVAELMQIKASENRIKIRLDVPETPAVVLGDTDELTQILQNLIDNAIKYGRPDTTVRVTIGLDAAGGKTPGKDSVTISVADEGEGIPPEHLPRLTERFYRVDADRSRLMGGTGLGLAIVKHIASRHNGTLSIQSTQGTGSTFTVSIPAADITL